MGDNGAVSRWLAVHNDESGSVGTVTSYYTTKVTIKKCENNHKQGIDTYATAMRESQLTHAVTLTAHHIASPLAPHRPVTNTDIGRMSHEKHPHSHPQSTDRSCSVGDTASQYAAGRACSNQIGVRTGSARTEPIVAYGECRAPWLG